LPHKVNTLGALVVIFFIAACSLFVKRTDAPIISTKEWQDVSSLFQQEIKKAGIENARIEIYDFNRKLQFLDIVGKFNRDQSIPLMSAAKWMSSALIMRLIEQGTLSLDDNIKKYLNSEGSLPLPAPKSQITIRQLLSHTSDITRSIDGSENDPAPCFSSAEHDLNSCGDLILKNAPKDIKPGSRFFYSDKNLTLLGLIAERTTKLKWAQLFDLYIKRPLKFNSESSWYAKPRTLKGSQNPRPAAGLRLSVSDYEKFLWMIVNQGQFQGRQILKPESISEMEKDQVSLVISKAGFKPPLDTESYGLGHWLKCEDPPNCKVISHSSRGWHGFVPFMDRHHQYYAIIGVYDPRPAMSKSVEDIATQLKPLIYKALKR
jgi:CubicO group peptidase (beta-lactamase class C family)